MRSPWGLTVTGIPSGPQEEDYPDGLPGRVGGTPVVGATMQAAAMGIGRGATWWRVSFAPKTLKLRLIFSELT